MRKKCDVTASEMLEMRNQGLSNKDIANCLDISYATVLKYIGKQDGRMENLAAFADTPPKRKKMEAKEEMPMIPKYEPKPTEETYQLGASQVTLCHADRALIISPTGGNSLLVDYNEVPELVQFLAWAMRTRLNIDNEPTL